MSLAVFRGIKKAVVMRNQVDALSHSSSPDFADDFVEADGAHVRELIAVRHFRSQFDNFVFEPGGTGAMFPYFQHVRVNKTADGWVLR